MADQVVSKINNLGNGASAIKIQADAANIDSPKQIVAETIAAFGDSIDILVNNAGKEFHALLPDITVEGYQSLFDTNVRSVIFMTQAVRTKFDRFKHLSLEYETIAQHRLPASASTQVFW